MIVDLDKDVDESGATDEDDERAEIRSSAKSPVKASSVDSTTKEISSMMKSALKLVDSKKDEEEKEEEDLEILGEGDEMKKKKESNIGVRQGEIGTNSI